MIKFFRHIRQNLIMENKTGKYLKYAIGEIVLVMIGILLALQVNNLNNQRLAKMEEQRIIKDLSTEIGLAIQSRINIIEEYTANQKSIALALDKIYSIHPISFTDDECISMAFSHVIRWDPNNISTLEELIATGKIALITDINLRNLLVEFKNLSSKHKERINQTIFEANVLVDDFPFEVKRIWKPNLQKTEFLCDLNKIKTNDAFLAKLQSNRGRMSAPISSAKSELEMLQTIQKLINNKSNK